MKRQFLLCSAVLFGLATTSAWHARAEDEGKEESEVKMSIKDVPDAVRATLKREANGADIKTVDKEKLDGKLVYEADAVIEGDNYEIIVSEKGKLISKKLDNEDTAKASEKKEGKESAKDEEDEKPSKKSKSEEKDEK